MQPRVTPLAALSGLRIERPAAEHRGHGGAALGEPRNLAQTADENDQRGAGRHPEEQVRVPEPAQGRGIMPVLEEDHRGDQIDGRRNPHHGEREIGDQEFRVPPGAVLALEEVHVG
jgi:hypothetical protein